MNPQSRPARHAPAARSTGIQVFAAAVALLVHWLLLLILGLAQPPGTRGGDRFGHGAGQAAVLRVELLPEPRFTGATEVKPQLVTAAATPASRPVPANDASSVPMVSVSSTLPGKERDNTSTRPAGSAAPAGMTFTLWGRGIDPQAPDAVPDVSGRMTVRLWLTPTGEVERLELSQSELPGYVVNEIQRLLSGRKFVTTPPPLQAVAKMLQLRLCVASRGDVIVVDECGRGPAGD